METATANVVKCPSCSADVVAGERFCAACGAALAAAGAPPPPPQMFPYVETERDRRLGGARKWLLAVSILFLVSGGIMFAIQQGEVEKQITAAEAQIAGMDRDAVDTMMKQQTGMTWEEAKAHDRGQVKLVLAVNVALSAMFLGMWLWARRNALAASVTALLVFITVIGINAVVDPKTLAQGIVVKIFFIAALAKAISVAQAERRATHATPA